MTAASFTRTLRAFTARRPFRPFLREFFSGTELLVGHPEALAIDGTAIIFRSADGRYRLFDSGSVCQLCDAATESDS